MDAVVSRSSPDTAASGAAWPALVAGCLALGIVFAAPLIAGVARVHPTPSVWGTTGLALFAGGVTGAVLCTRPSGNIVGGLILAVLAGVATLAARSATFNGALLAGAGACGVAGAALVAMLRPPSTRRGLFVAVLAFVGVALGGTLSVALTPAVAALAAGAC